MTHPPFTTPTIPGNQSSGHRLFPVKTHSRYMLLALATVIAGWLLNTFTTVVQAQRDRGDLRLAQQAQNGEWLLPDERHGQLEHAQPLTLAQTESSAI